MTLISLPKVRATSWLWKPTELSQPFLVVGTLLVVLLVIIEWVLALTLRARGFSVSVLSLTFVISYLSAILMVMLLRRLYSLTSRLVKEAVTRADALRYRSELILNTAADSIWVVDAEGRTVFSNAAAVKVTGWNLEEVQGKHHHDFLRHSDGSGRVFEVSDCPICNAVKAGKSYYAADNSFWNKGGTHFPVEYTVTPVVESEQVTGAVLSFKNTYEHRLLQSKLVQAQKLESIGQLAAGIAHEINTPIQFIGDNTLFLKEAFADIARTLDAHSAALDAAAAIGVASKQIAEAKEIETNVDLPYLYKEVPSAIDQSLEGINRVAKIVRAMKDFSHPDGDSKAPADLNKAIESTATVARNEWKYVAELALELDPNLPPVACLVGALNQVVLNLIVNAAHAIEDVRKRTGTKGKITISTSQEDNHAVIRIADTGGGIPASARSKIFDPFFTTKPVGKGTGQGLAIAYSVIVEKHRGSIHFETELDKGTTFIIRLPLKAAANGSGDSQISGG